MYICEHEIKYVLRIDYLNQFLFRTVSVKFVFAEYLIGGIQEILLQIVKYFRYSEL